ncbi:MAG: hypothetical protein D4S01_03805 [Dehalococcoidia bacterium]|nr:MAG: hypothetical protein D4S01_03805 [Dehalococcoidia bacterium]
MLVASTSMDEIFSLIVLASSPALTHKLLTEAFKIHGGLAVRMRRFKKDMEPYESLSYMWQALLIAPFEWDPSLGSATTCLFKVARRVIEDEGGHSRWIDGVRFPKQYKQEVLTMSIDTVDEALLAESPLYY